MEISCPSCRRKYQTEEYKNDFEIVCTCGYSILVPDESRLQNEKDEAAAEIAGQNIALNVAEPTNLEPEQQSLDEPLDVPDFSSEPATLDAEDEAFSDPGLGIGGEEPQISEEPGPEILLTPPEQLPEEMPYDRFEIQGFDSPAPPSEDIAPPFEEPVAPKPTEIKKAVSSKAKAATAAAPKSSRVQVLIEKSVRSSLGQILGYSYNLKLSDINEQDFKQLRVRASEFCHFRPWLGDEVKKRNIIIDDMTLNEWISNVPEPLAIEIYLKALEMGGNCEFLISS